VAGYETEKSGWGAGIGNAIRKVENNRQRGSGAKRRGVRM